MTTPRAPDPRKVFVVHGRNAVARDGMFDFLRAIGLDPIDWSSAVRLTEKGSPYIGEILDAAFTAARAIVVLMTPDEIAYLRPEYAAPDDPADLEPGAQPRPNVLFEAGMALGHDADRTILVEVGKVRPFSDVAGRHVIRMDGGAARRKDLANRLETAGCAVDLSHDDWTVKGDLTPPAVLLPPAPTEVEPAPSAKVREAPFDEIGVDADYLEHGKGRGRLIFTNSGSIDLHDLRFKLPPEAGSSFHVAADLPIAKLPVGKSVGFVAMRTMGSGADNFEIPITARTPDGSPVETAAFVSLVT
jgi:hypothetical protein